MSQSSEITRVTHNVDNSLLSLPALNTGNESGQENLKRSWWKRPGGITLIIFVLLVLIF